MDYTDDGRTRDVLPASRPAGDTVNLAIKNILLITAKNAVNAVLTSSVLMVLNNGAFNFRNPDGWWNLGKAVASVIIGREVAVWVPILLKWSSTSANPAAELEGGGVYVPPLADRKQ